MLTRTAPLSMERGIPKELYSWYSRESEEACFSEWTAFTDEEEILVELEWTKTLYLCAIDWAWLKWIWSWTYTLDMTAPTCQVQYSTEDNTTENVIASLTWCSEDIVDATEEHVFTENDNYTFEFVDEAWNTWYVTAIVNRIDREGPTISATNNELWFNTWITIVLNISDTSPMLYAKYSRTWVTECIDEWISFSDWDTIVYNEEWEKTLYLCAKDKAWNEWTRDGTYRIDKTPPICFISYDPETQTQWEVTATLNSCSEEVTANAWTYTFTENGEYTFTFSDIAWNIVYLPATVDWISSSSQSNRSWWWWRHNNTTSDEHGSADDEEDNTWDDDVWDSTSDEDNTSEESDSDEDEATWDEITEYVEPTDEDKKDPIAKNIYQAAYERAYKNWITDATTFEWARMFDDISRAEMAKLSTIFAIRLFKQTPDENKLADCSKFADIRDISSELHFYTIQSCQLWYMWYESNWVDYLTNFRPNDPVTEAEVATIFSRVMWWTKYAAHEWEEWYIWHIRALYEKTYIDNVSTPFNNEKRWDVFVTMWRIAAKKQKIK